MYLLIIMAIRPDALPTDLAALTEMVLALDAENEKLRVAMQTLKEMMFGKRSERLAALVAECQCRFKSPQKCRSKNPQLQGVISR